MNVYIIYRNFLNKDKTTVSLGGIQTYIINLCHVIEDLNMTPIICQISDTDFMSRYENIRVCAFCANDATLSKTVISKLSLKDEPIIFGSHELIVDYSGPSIAIQHGITWDTPVHAELIGWKNLLYIFQRARMGYKTLKLIAKVDHLVCVDYNFVNWYRTQVAHPETEMTVIPNFAQPQEVIAKDSTSINIIFARRMFWYRGTRVFIEVMEELLSKYNNLNFTIAGTGPDEELFRQKFKDNPHVQIMHYKSEDSYLIHRNQHIAVIPTLGSEGTSLSLLEAMASQCAIVCTNVGGMTNIVIDNYNGLIVNPNKNSILQALIHLIDNENDRAYMAYNGYQTVEAGFSLSIWMKKWHDIIVEAFLKKS